MSAKLSPINADEATKAAVVAYAAERGISQTKALAEMVALSQTEKERIYDEGVADAFGAVNPLDPELVAVANLALDRAGFDVDVATRERLLAMALERSQSPAETLSAALDALARPGEIPLVRETIERWKLLVQNCVEAAGAAPCHEMDAVETNRTSVLALRSQIIDGLQPLSPAIVQPAEKPLTADEYGVACRCDGEAQPGPWHQKGCERRTTA